MASNHLSIDPVEGARRFSQARKEYVAVPRPHLIGVYNKCMGGTDQMDQQLSAYRPCIRNRKWYWPFFTFSLGVALYNSWHLYKQLEKDCSFLDHVRSIAKSYLHAHTFERKIVKCSRPRSFHNSRVAKRVEDAVRYDGINHLLGVAPKTRCGLCGGTVQKKCTKCNINLHPRCFAEFHGYTH